MADAVIEAMQAVQNRRTDLPEQRWLQRWKVNAPKVAGSVPLKRYEQRRVIINLAYIPLTHG